MRTMIDGVALLAGFMGIAAGAAAGENDAGVAGKRGLSPIIQGMAPMLAMLVATGAVLVFLAGCVMHETYGDHAAPESDRAVVDGYWHYRFLYDEELHVVSVGGTRDDRKGGWPYAYSISLPSGRHWLQLAVLRNSNEIARCAFEWTFEAQHRYKLQRVDHDQFLLAHPSSSPFAASISMKVTAPSKSVHDLKVSAVCAKDAMCRQNSDCTPQYSCQMNAAFAFGICRPT
jgi:hypothetical protein